MWWVVPSFWVAKAEGSSRERRRGYGLSWRQEIDNGSTVTTVGRATWRSAVDTMEVCFVGTEPAFGGGGHDLLLVAVATWA